MKQILMGMHEQVLLSRQLCYYTEAAVEVRRAVV